MQAVSCVVWCRGGGGGGGGGHFLERGTCSHQMGGGGDVPMAHPTMLCLLLVLSKVGVIIGSPISNLYSLNFVREINIPPFIFQWLVTSKILMFYNTLSYVCY